jgi:hypothetical protein
MSVTVLTIIIAVLVLAAGLFVLRAMPAVSAYFNFRGKRLVTCPETHNPEAVDVAAAEAGVGSLLQRTHATPQRMLALARASRLRPGLSATGRSRCTRLPGVEYRRQLV